jgi:predicted glycogen debranching enzyme
MSVLDFDKASLGNLEYSLRREMLSTNRSGGYMSTTIVCCNTRKYHGLMVVPIEETGGARNYVMLSSLDETIVQRGEAFNLAIHRFPGVYEPRGHKYITDFRYTPTPTITYRVGGVTLRKEMLWIHSRAQIMIRYTVLEATLPVTLRLRPFLAFRDAHGLSQANMYANGRAYPVEGGVKCRLYEKFPWLHMQINRDSEFVEAPDWYYKFEYPEEQRRGYPWQEDLLTPGYFELELTTGQSATFCCRLDEPCSREAIDAEFDSELGRRSDKDDFLSCLRHSGRQFIARRGGRTEVIAGYPWFGCWGRDTLIALPGITLTQGGTLSCGEALDTMVDAMRDGLFPNVGEAYNSVDAPLWFFWTLQQFCETEGREAVWRRYGAAMKAILAAFVKNKGDIEVHDNALVWASNPTRAMTWMDAVVDGRPVTGRDGYQVEINALWYNAVCFALDMAREFHDTRFTGEWKGWPERIRSSFQELFWLPGEGWLADYVGAGGANRFIRPNQIVACSLEHTMLSAEQVHGVMETVRQHLLTPKGLRTLSPRNPLYEGRYEGDQPTRDRQYHQGTVWPWLLEHYAAAGFRIHGDGFAERAAELIAGFEEDLDSYGIGSVSEIYDGDPPHNQRGAISQAWSVGAVLRIRQMIDRAEERQPKKRAKR